MNILRGNIFDLAINGEIDVIVHGCNCYNKMGSGIAKEVKERFPAAYRRDLAFMPNVAPRKKLGLISGAQCFRNGRVIYIVNAYIQQHYGHDGVYVELDALASCFAKVKAKFSGLRIGYPMIGCGLAGGDWNQISPIIGQQLFFEDHSLVLLEEDF